MLWDFPTKIENVTYVPQYQRSNILTDDRGQEVKVEINISGDAMLQGLVVLGIGITPRPNMTTFIFLLRLLLGWKRANKQDSLLCRGI